MRVLIADDSVLLREGLALILADGGHEVVGGVGTGDERVSRCLSLRPDLTISDIRMPPSHTDEGLRACVRIRETWAQAPILLLSQYIVLSYATELLSSGSGSIGYLLKDSPREDILAAVLSAAVGRSMLSPAVTTRLVGAARGTGRGADGSPCRAGAPVSLSPRERQVLQAASRGLSNNQIGAELYITEATVKTHLLRAYAKLGVDSRTAAVTEALRRGLLELD